jgi:hypothetical protein
MTIIAISGKKRVGKDTFGDVLHKKYGFSKIAFADPLRNLCSRVFYLDPSVFIDDDKKDAHTKRIILDFHDIDAIRNIVQNEWGYNINEEMRNSLEEFHGTEFDTPRDILRTVGTNMLRYCVSDNIWVEMAANKIKETGGRIVITDCRFQTERDFLRKIGALLCLVKRNDNGETKEHEFDLGSEDEYDVVFTNDTTLHAYQSSVDMWFNTKQAEFAHYKVWKYE